MDISEFSTGTLKIMRDNKVLLFTPVYYSSPGTQARINFIKRSLNIVGYNTSLIVGNEGISKKLYAMFGEVLLTRKSIWDLVGRMIAEKILSNKPESVILFTDICASAVPYLSRRGVKVVLSIEDLTPEYREYSVENSRIFFKLLKEYAMEADLIITPSFTLERRLRDLDIKAYVVPIGLEPVLGVEEASSRELLLLHAGQVNDRRKLAMILSLAEKYQILLHDVGAFSKRIHHPNVRKYRVTSPEDALRLCKRASIGLVIEHRRAYTLTRLYYHVAMLQPIVGCGIGPWLDEAKILGIEINSIELIENIYEDYDDFVAPLVKIVEKLKLPDVHKLLLNFLR